MTRASVGQPLPTKSSYPVDFNGGKTGVILTPKFNEAEESIRVLLRKHLPHGSKQDLAKVTGQHVNHVSSQLSGESGIHDKTVSAALWILLGHPDLHAVVTAVRMIREGRPTELREKAGLLIEFSDGQLCLPGLPGRKA